ncbi:MAG: hypothetical protein LC107_14460 [Chitinophagales bacterium]|nr:hypothetical protein [Chitinophagales bacterium]
MKILPFLYLVWCICFCSVLRSQNISLGYGPTYITDKEKVKLHPDVLGKDDSGNDWYFTFIKYEHKINKNLLISCSYSKYLISTYFHFYKKNEGGSFGWAGTNVKRFDMGMTYNIFPKSKFILHPNVGFGLQKSIPTGHGCICNDISNGIKPDDFELLKEIDAYAYSNTQIVPVVGLKFGYAFWNRLELFMDIQQVFGFKTIQELRMSYT